MPGNFKEPVQSTSVTVETNSASSHMPRLFVWWERGVLCALIVSIALLGIGRMTFFIRPISFSAWSISRTAFFFWLTWKIVLSLRFGWRAARVNHASSLVPMLVFFAAVTASLLPDFHQASDYPYLFFAVMHCVMVLDLFAPGERPGLLLLLLGLLPGVLVIRGIAYDPSVLNFSLANRFDYPLAHANSAGLLFAMSIPLGLAVLATQRNRLRVLASLSLAAQFVGLLLTYSRGAWLGCGVSLFGVGLLEPRLKKNGLVLGLMGLVAFVAITPLRDRLLSLVHPRADAAIEERLRFMESAWTVGVENPVLGYGYGRDRLREGVKKEVDDAAELGFIPHSHNMYTELLAETGVLGLGAFLWMIGANLLGLIRRARTETSASSGIFYLALAASLLAFLVGILGDAPFYNHDTRIFFFTLLPLTCLFLRGESPVPTR